MAKKSKSELAKTKYSRPKKSKKKGNKKGRKGGKSKASSSADEEAAVEISAELGEAAGAEVESTTLGTTSEPEPSVLLEIEHVAKCNWIAVSSLEGGMIAVADNAKDIHLYTGVHR